MRTVFNLVTEAHIFTTLIFLFSCFTLANFNSYTKKNPLLFYKGMIFPATIIFFIFILSNVLPIYKLILLAESLFFVLVSIYQVINKSLKTVSTIFLGLILSLFLIFTGFINTLSNYSLKLFCLAHIVAIVLYFLSEVKIKGTQEAEKIHLVNAVSTLVILFSYSQDGAFFMLAIRIFYFVVVFKNLHTLCKKEASALDDKIKALNKEFDDTLRKEVKKQLFYHNLSKEKMLEMAKLDEMTKIYNKKTILNAIKDNISENKNTKFSLLIFDIDKFKDINDSLGHIQGDKCIIELANIAKESLREKDMLGRYGGDEFFAIIHDADLQSAAQIAERLRQRVEKTLDPHYTISIGISNYPEDGQHDKQLIAHADNGLYIAKRKGGNGIGYAAKKTNL